MSSQVAETLRQIASWSAADRIELAHQLWDELLDAGEVPISDPELDAELERRYAAYKENPTNVLTWEEIVTYVRRPR